MPAPEAPDAARQKIVALHAPEKTKKTQMLTGPRPKPRKNSCGASEEPGDMKHGLAKSKAQRHEDIGSVSSWLPIFVIKACVILVIAEQRGGKLNRATWEAIAAAQELAGGRVRCAGRSCSCTRRRRRVGGRRTRGCARPGSRARGPPALELYTPDGYSAALAAAIADCHRLCVLLPHTYQTRDFAPKLAARIDRALVTDATAVKTLGAERAFVRPMFQGKLVADVVPQGASAASRHVAGRRLSRGPGGQRDVAALRSGRSP